MFHGSQAVGLCSSFHLILVIYDKYTYQESQCAREKYAKEIQCLMHRIRHGVAIAVEFEFDRKYFLAMQKLE